jgi:hypothetical protein
MGVFRIAVENIIAAGEANAGRALKVPSIPLGLLTKIKSADPD